jgi:hypothetical protein
MSELSSWIFLPIMDIEIIINSAFDLFYHVCAYFSM